MFWNAKIAYQKIKDTKSCIRMKIPPFYEMIYPEAKVCFQLWKAHPKLKIQKFHLELFQPFF